MTKRGTEFHVVFRDRIIGSFHRKLADAGYLIGEWKPLSGDMVDTFNELIDTLPSLQSGASPLSPCGGLPIVLSGVGSNARRRPALVVQTRDLGALEKYGDMVIAWHTVDR